MAGMVGFEAAATNLDHWVHYDEPWHEVFKFRNKTKLYFVIWWKKKAYHKPAIDGSSKWYICGEFAKYGDIILSIHSDK